MQKFNLKPAFTLLETLISVAILAILLSAILQSQSDLVRLVYRTERRLQIEKYVNLELLQVERNYSNVSLGVTTGEFKKDHELFGGKWQKEVKDEEQMQGIKVRKVIYSISWEDQGKSYSYESFIIIDCNQTENSTSESTESNSS